MNAAASLAPARVPSAAPMDRPMVLLDGVIEPGLVVEQIESAGPLDTRRAVLRAVEPWPRAGQWMIVQPLRLVDGGVRRRVLVTGAAPRRLDADRLELADVWNRVMDQPLSHVPALGRGGELVMQTGGGLAETRSGTRHEVNGHSVYVLERAGARWSVGEALESLAAFAGLPLNLCGIPIRIAAAPLVAPIDLALPLGRVLEQVIEPYGLYVTRQAQLEGHTRIERAAVRPYAHGRPIRLRWARPGQTLGEVLRITRRKPQPGSRLWIAAARGPVVESTFELVGGWDPNLEGAADAEYDRAAGSDFTTYANVYRHWVINEDGAYTGPPFDRGAAYDLAALFQHGPIAPTPLRLLDCLTLDEAGRPLRPIVEYSTDDGLSWSRWPGRVRELEDRAGVYLDDATLPAAYLAAAQAGHAKLRVTASLRSPLPVEVARWQGNPFAGLRPQRRLDLSRLFVFKWLDPGSTHHDAVRSGARNADERDDGPATVRWLIDRMWCDERTLASREGEATLTLTGGGTVCPGDRLFDAGARGRDLDGQSQAVRRDGAVVTRVTQRFDTARTELKIKY